MPSTLVSPHALRTSLQADLLASYDELIPRTGWQRERIRAHQDERLRGLLHHAAGHSPFHAERLAGLDLDAVTPDDLSAVPVMTKADLMEHFDDVVTDPASPGSGLSVRSPTPRTRRRWCRTRWCSPRAGAPAPAECSCSNRAPAVSSSARSRAG